MRIVLGLLLGVALMMCAPTVAGAMVFSGLATDPISDAAGPDIQLVSAAYDDSADSGAAGAVGVKMQFAQPLGTYDTTGYQARWEVSDTEGACGLSAFEYAGITIVADLTPPYQTTVTGTGDGPLTGNAAVSADGKTLTVGMKGRAFGPRNGYDCAVGSTENSGCASRCDAGDTFALKSASSSPTPNGPGGNPFHSCRGVRRVVKGSIVATKNMSCPSARSMAVRWKRACARRGRHCTFRVYDSRRNSRPCDCKRHAAYRGDKKGRFVDCTDTQEHEFMFQWRV